MVLRQVLCVRDVKVDSFLCLFAKLLKACTFSTENVKNLFKIRVSLLSLLWGMNRNDEAFYSFSKISIIPLFQPRKKKPLSRRARKYRLFRCKFRYFIIPKNWKNKAPYSRAKMFVIRIPLLLFWFPDLGRCKYHSCNLQLCESQYVSYSFVQLMTVQWGYSYHEWIGILPENDILYEFSYFLLYYNTIIQMIFFQKKNLILQFFQWYRNSNFKRHLKNFFARNAKHWN